MAQTQLTEIGGVALRDQIKQPLYDSLDITSDSVITAERQFFSSTQGKSLTQSNLRGNGALERNKSFRIMGIQVDAVSNDTAKTELLSLFSTYSFCQLWLAEKQYWESPLRLLTGKVSHFSTFGEGRDAHVSYGETTCNPVMFHAEHALDIGPLTNFYMLWKVEGASAAHIEKMTPSLASPVRFVCQLKGVLRRPVQ